MPDDLAELLAAKEAAEEDLMAIEGVEGVGIGLLPGDPPGTEPAIVVGADPDHMLDVREAVPDQVGGHPVRVAPIRIELAGGPGTVAEQVGADRKEYADLRGGICVGPCKTGFFNYSTGTLGVVVHENGTNNPVLLSNWHVLYHGGLDNGAEIAQPDRDFNWPFPCKVVGTNLRYHVGGVPSHGRTVGVDCGIARQTQRTQTYYLIEGLATIQPGPFPDPAVHMNVTKRGYASLYTAGTVATINYSTTHDFGPPIGVRQMPNQTIVAGAGGGEFAIHGDSGSIIVHQNGPNSEAVALLWATATYNHQTHCGVASGMDAVAGVLGIH